MANWDDLDHRVSRLEDDVAHLRATAQHATDVAGNAHDKAMSAETAHHKNIQLLNALRQTQAEHTQVLAEHSRRLDGIDGRLDGIDGRLDRIDGCLDGIDGRLDAVDGKLGGLAMGMHAVEQLLTRLVEDEGPAGAV